MTEHADLPPAQAKLLAAVLRDFTHKLEAGEQARTRCIHLMSEGQFPELFRSLGSASHLAECVQEGMLPVWQAVEDTLRQRGYHLMLTQPESGPWSISAELRHPVW